MIKLTCSIFIFSNKFFIYFFTFIKMSKDSSGKYCQNNKERPQKIAHERYQNLSKEEKEKKTKYSHEWYKDLPEVGKQVWVEYRRNVKREKMPYYNYKKLFIFQKR